MDDLLIIVVPPAITGIATIVAALMQNMDWSARHWLRLLIVPGAIATGVLAFGLLVWFVDRAAVNAEDWQDLQTNTLDEFPESPVGLADQTASDLDAKAVLVGAGPDEWPLSDGTSIATGDVFYVDDWEWVNVVFPSGGREDPDASCGIEVRGTLTVRGFSTARNAALIEYRAPGEPSGTPCKTGTYFFYPVPFIR